MRHTDTCLPQRLSQYSCLARGSLLLICNEQLKLWDPYCLQLGCFCFPGFNLMLCKTSGDVNSQASRPALLHQCWHSGRL